MKSSFWVIPKNTYPNLCKPIHDIINYSTSIWPFKSGKCGKEGEKLQKFEYLKNEKSFLDEMKNIFHSFQRAIFWWKNSNLIENSGHKLETYRTYSLIITSHITWNRNKHFKQIILHLPQSNYWFFSVDAQVSLTFEIKNIDIH